MRKHYLVASVATTALALLVSSQAIAQSTADQVQEVIVTGSRQPVTVMGAMSQVKDAKDESVVSQVLFSHESPGQNAGQLINLIPGVTFSEEDPTGVSSGDLRIHGQDGAHVSIQIDGAPVNDTGNYSSYLGEYLIGELTDHITVNLGATDVDSPTASAVGGVVNIVSKLPPTTAGAIAQVSGGSYNFQREFAELDTGSFGPFGTRAYAAFNMQDSDKYKGSGTLPRIGGDFRIYQPLQGDNFVSLAGTYVEERANFYYSASKAQLAQFGRNYDYNDHYVQPTAVNGQADTVPAGGEAGTDAYYNDLRINPVNFGQLRGQSYLTILPNLHFTFDPYFFYTLANGGGATAVSEKDPRLIGSSTTAKGVDLNGDGDILDSVLLYTPSNTETHRFGVNTSLLYDLDHHDHFQVAYAADYGEHRQTGAATFIDGGEPNNVFGAIAGYGVPVKTADGSLLRTRDRYSIASLNQFTFNYLGNYLDDRLHINLGVRDPFFIRHLNQYCYTYNGTSAYCTTASEATINADAAAVASSHGSAASLAALRTYIPGVTYNSATGQANLRDPYTQRFAFNKPLPNVGATYKIADNHTVYVTYAESFSAPKTDDLYTSATDLVKPETSREYGAGYRYQSHIFTASLNGYYEIYNNRIVQSYDPDDPTTSIDRNVGTVDIYGLDAEAGFSPIKHLNLYTSASWLHSDVRNNYASVLNGVTFYVPSAGKELVDTPDYTFAERVQYDLGPFTIGLQGKYTSSRWTTDVNDDKTPGYATFDLDARYNLDLLGYKGAYIQANVDNLFDRYYLGRISSAANATSYTSTAGTVAAGTPFFYVGAPRTFYITVRAAF